MEHSQSVAQNVEQNVGQVVNQGPTQESVQDIKAFSTNNTKKSLSDDEMYHHLIEKRIELANFLSRNLESLEYDEIRNVFARICRDKERVTVQRLLNGTLGGPHNARMSFSVFPTINLYRVITKILNKFAISKLTDIGTGIGLIPFLFERFNTHIRNRCMIQKSVSPSDTVPLRSITCSDPGYQLSTTQRIKGPVIKSLDLCEYVIDEKQQYYDESSAYIFIDPIFAPDHNMLELIAKFMHHRKPKVVMIMGDMPQAIETHSMYKCCKVYPKTFCINDSLHNISAQTPTTHFKLYIFVRNDLYVDIDHHIFGNDILQGISDVSLDALNMLVDNGDVPVCCRDVKDEIKAAHINEKLFNLKIRLPPHLENLDEVGTYLNLFEMALRHTGQTPDILHKRENFIALRRYVNDVWIHLDEMKDSGIVPAHLSLEQAALFLIKDCCYSNKISTGLFSEFIKKS